MAAIEARRPRDASAPGGRRSGAAWVLAAVLISVLPAWLVRIPPLLDYPNHYVRMWLIAGGASLPPLSQMYAVNWSGASTNIAIDLIAWMLGGLLPMTVIGPLVLSLAIMLPPLGVLLLGQGLFRRARWWHLLCFVLAWNWTLVAGFINFDVSLGLALLGAAFDVRWARRGWVMLAALRVVMGGLVILAHPFGFPFYAALIAGLAFGPDLAPLRSPAAIAQALARIVRACLPMLLPFAVLILLAPVLPGGHAGHHPAMLRWPDPTVSAHVSMLLSGIKTYRLPVDALFGLLLALPILIALIRGRLRVHAGLLGVTLLLTIVALLMPSMMFGAFDVETRVPCMMAPALCVALLPDLAWSRRASVQAAAVALLVVASRTAWIGDIWLQRQSDFASVSRALEQVPAGAAVLPLEHLPSLREMARAPVGRFLGGRNPAYVHEPLMAIMDRRAFVPTLFAAAGQQPIRVLPPWNAIASPAGTLAPVNRLGDASTLIAPYIARWRQCFDYILVVNADMPNAGGPMPTSDAIVPVADEGFARLYRIVHDHDATACHQSDPLVPGRKAG